MWPPPSPTRCAELRTWRCSGQSPPRSLGPASSTPTACGAKALRGGAAWRPFCGRTTALTSPGSSLPSLSRHYSTRVLAKSSPHGSSGRSSETVRDAHHRALPQRQVARLVTQRWCVVFFFATAAQQTLWTSPSQGWRGHSKARPGGSRPASWISSTPLAKHLPAARQDPQLTDSPCAWSSSRTLRAPTSSQESDEDSERERRARGHVHARATHHDVM
mmetsp:Transcript_22945/g.62253  ORF Transcript_22945/g.62253 Transcript_22945/m.62253 type:complete len:218 (+) Transcript_22945:273-926(+)